MRIEWLEPAILDVAALRDYIVSDAPIFSHCSLPQLSGGLLKTRRRHTVVIYYDCSPNTSSNYLPHRPEQVHVLTSQACQQTQQAPECRRDLQAGFHCRTLTGLAPAGARPNAKLADWTILNFKVFHDEVKNCLSSWSRWLSTRPGKPASKLTSSARRNSPPRSHIANAPSTPRSTTCLT